MLNITQTNSENRMVADAHETLELSIDQLENVAGGDMAIDLAVKAYEALGQRLMDAIHKPVTSPSTTSLHMR